MFTEILFVYIDASYKLEIRKLENLQGTVTPSSDSVSTLW